jgi:hypothetical protein
MPSNLLEVDESFGRKLFLNFQGGGKSQAKTPA